MFFELNFVIFLVSLREPPSKFRCLLFFTVLLVSLRNSQFFSRFIISFCGL